MSSSIVSRRDSACSQEKADSQLCRSCRYMFSSLLRERTSIRREIFSALRWCFFGNGRSIRALVNNAKKGCVACNLFLESLSEQERLLLTRSRHAWPPSSHMVSSGEESLTNFIISYLLCKNDLQDTTLKEISLGITMYQNIGRYYHPLQFRMSVRL